MAHEERDYAIRLQYEHQVALGKSPSLAVKWTAFRSGLKQAQVREIVQMHPPAVCRLPHQQESGTV